MEAKKAQTSLKELKSCKCKMRFTSSEGIECKSWNISQTAHKVIGKAPLRNWRSEPSQSQCDLFTTLKWLSFCDFTLTIGWIFSHIYWLITSYLLQRSNVRPTLLIKTYNHQKSFSSSLSREKLFKMITVKTGAWWL